MKALIISDVHSNADALRAIWEQENDCDAVYCAGDIVDYGPQPAETIEWLEARNVNCVQGNHDACVIDAWNSGEYKNAPAGQLTWAHHNCRNLRPEHIAFLERLPKCLSFEMDNACYLLRHSFRQDYGTIETYYHFDKHWSENYKLPLNFRERRMIFGHTHRQGAHILSDGALWMNPGSASYRREDDPTKGAYYGVIEDGQIFLRHVQYDRGRLLDAAQKVRDELSPGQWQIAFFFFGEPESRDS